VATEPYVPQAEGGWLDQPVSNKLGGFEGFVASALSSIPETFGVQPGRAIEDWRARHPTGALSSTLLGAAVPFIGWEYAAAKGVPGIANWVLRTERMLPALAESRPIVAGALREIARDAPLVATQTLGQLGGGYDTEDTLLWAGIGTGVAGTVGGVKAAFRAIGAPDAMRPQRVGVDVRKPPQLQFREVLERLREPNPGPALLRTADDIRLEILSERPRPFLHPGAAGPRRRAVNWLVGAEDGANQRINRLFGGEAGPEGKIPVRRFIVEDFGGDQAALTAARTKAGIDDTALQYAQFPRFITPTSNNQAKSVQASIEAGMRQVGPDTWVGRETANGMWVLAKRVERGPVPKRGKPDRARAGDQWVLLKTDAPGHFAPGGADWANMANGYASLFGSFPKAADPTLEVMGAQQRAMNETPLYTYAGIAERNPGLFTRKFLSRLNLAPGSAMYQHISRFASEYLAPAVFQFRDPAQAWAYAMMRKAFGDSESIANRILYGRATLEGSGWKAVFDKIKPGKGLVQQIDALEEEDILGLQAAFHSQDPFATAGLTPKAVELLHSLAEADRYSVDQFRRTLAIVDPKEAKKFVPIENHLMLTRTWRGHLRQRVYDENGKLVWMAAGKTHKEVQDEVKGLLAANPGWRTTHWKDGPPEHIFTSDRENDLSLAAQLKYEKLRASGATKSPKGMIPLPKFVKSRKGVGGYIGHGRPITKQELKDIVSGHVVTMQRKIAELSTQHNLQRELVQMQSADPRAYEKFRARFNDLAGRQGEFSRVQNAVADKVLSPWLGTNSASKIVRAINGATMSLQLGMANLMFPVVNALTMVQTVMPHAAFVVSGDMDRVGQYYTIQALFGKDGLARGTLGVLDMWRLMKQSFRLMGDQADVTWKAALENALNDGVISPRLVEEWVGKDARQLGQIKSVAKSPGQWADYVRTVSDFLPSSSERFARLQAFSTGYLLARDILKLDPEKHYGFAKKFTENTMYLYTTADRSRILTGPLGSLFGMFKNWMFHYLWQMGDYVREAKQGNVAPLLWSLGGATALGGIGATPIGAAADLMSQWFTDKSLMEQIYGALGGGQEEGPGSVNLGDAVMYGLPAFLPELVGLPGISLASSTATPFSEPLHDIQFLTSFAAWERAKAAGAAIGDSVTNYLVTGKLPIDSATVRNDLIRAFAPRSLQRILAAEGNQINSLSTGYPSVSGLSIGQSFLYQMGFNPVAVEKQWAVGQELWADQERLREAIRWYGQSYADATMQGDYKTATRLLRRAMVQGLPTDSILRSARSRTDKATTPATERNFSEEAVRPFEQLGLTG
jgi:hypothetical protein